MNSLPPLLPQPEEMRLSGGEIALASVTSVRAIPRNPETRRIALEISREIARATGGPPLLSAGAEGEAAGDAGAVLTLVVDPGERTLDDEGYRLSVGPKEIRLVGTTPAGLFYASRTLLQLLPLEPAGDAALPCLEILDRPRFAWRGLHLDVSRHFFPVERIQQLIESLALHKLNRFHWHLTDDQGWRIEIPRHPRLAEIGGRRVEGDGALHGGCYTREEIRAVVTHAAERQVTVVPEIETPGHALAALAAYPELSCTGGPFRVPHTWGIFEDVFCAGNEQTFRLLGDVFAEVASLFPGPYIHVGGDECPTTRWEACPACRRRITEQGFAQARQLQGYFIRRIAALPGTAGRRLIGWDEILMGAPPRETVVMSWRGSEGGRAAARAGHEVIMCPAETCYLDSYQGPRDLEPEAFPRDVPLAAVYGFDPLPAGLTPEEGSRILGAQGNIWTERIPTWSHLEYMAFPRACALAERLWSPAARCEWQSFRRRLGGHLLRLEARGVRYRPLD